jgi:hypothetical protein
MTLKPGDKVKFLNDVGGGIVKSVNKQTAYVENDDGFEIPVPFSELIKIEEEIAGFSEPELRYQHEIPKKQAETEKIPKPSDIITESYVDSTDESGGDDEMITTENSTLNILLGLVPVKSKHGGDPEFKIYMISDCAYRMFYTLSVIKENFCYGYKSGMVEDDTKILVGTLSMAELRELQAFKTNCIFFKKNLYLPHEPLIYEYKIDVFTLSDPTNWKENDYFDEKAIIINLTEESLLYEIERMVSENEEKYVIQKKRKEVKAKPADKPQTDNIEEVDLHIEQLVDDFSGLSSGEILDLQMSRFSIALEGGIRNNIKRMVFIHGMGNGKLKYEIRKTLENKYPKLKFQDASFKEYGYGATMVILK